jgi:sulfate transport system permease protein
MTMVHRSRSVLPGFGLTFGFTTFFLSAVVLIPLAAMVLMTASMDWNEFVDVIFDPRALGSYRLSFGASLLAATINLVFGFIIAWTLVRYEFPGRKLIDALIDMPFALPTAVSGIALTTVFAQNGWIVKYPDWERAKEMGEVTWVIECDDINIFHAGLIPNS